MCVCESQSSCVSKAVGLARPGRNDMLVDWLRDFQKPISSVYCYMTLAGHLLRNGSGHARGQCRARFLHEAAGPGAVARGLNYKTRKPHPTPQSLPQERMQGVEKAITLHTHKITQRKRTSSVRQI